MTCFKMFPMGLDFQRTAGSDILASLMVYLEDSPLDLILDSCGFNSIQFSPYLIWFSKQFNNPPNRKIQQLI